jgi:nuclear transport factor 2 (NTF2) superfamily protein
MSESRPPFPPFDAESAAKKVQAAEDAWNTCDPERVASAYSVDSTPPASGGAPPGTSCGSSTNRG